MSNPTLLLEVTDLTIDQLEACDGDDRAHIDVLEAHRDALIDAMMVA